MRNLTICCLQAGSRGKEVVVPVQTQRLRNQTRQWNKSHSELKVPRTGVQWYKSSSESESPRTRSAYVNGQEKTEVLAQAESKFILLTFCSIQAPSEGTSYTQC